MLLTDNSELATDALSLIVWDKETKQYVYDKSNRVVSDPILKKHIEVRLEPYSKKADDLVTDLINERITFEDWQEKTAQTIKKSHLEMMRFGRGGKDQTFANQYLQVANELRQTQYKYFRENLATDIKAGTQTEAQIRSRVNSYISSGSISYEKGRASYWEEKGAKSYIRGLGKCQNHCNPCIYFASLGRLPLTLIIYQGQYCDCLNNCCCSLTMSTKPPTRGAGAKLKAYIAG